MKKSRLYVIKLKRRWQYDLKRVVEENKIREKREIVLQELYALLIQYLYICNTSQDPFTET